MNLDLLEICGILKGAPRLEHMTDIEHIPPHVTNRYRKWRKYNTGF